ncbi:hypothetical protein M8C21_002950, partial [Ambrosia artemisiifolia]
MSRFYRHHRKHTTDNDDDDPPMARIDGLLYSASRSQNDKSSVTGESAVKDVAFDADNLKQTLSALDDYDSSKQVKQFGDKSPKDDDNERLFHPIFDICPKRVSSLNKRKAPLHAMNREKQNQTIKILGPGKVLMKGYISSDDQISIVRTCRDLGIGGGGFYQLGKLPLQMMCLGKNWDPESHMYTELRPFDKCKPPAIPEKFHEMVNKAIQDSNEFLRGNIDRSVGGKVVSSMSPDICIVNFYTRSGRLGLHQEKDESEKSLEKGLRPVVSFSIGDSAEFLYGDTQAIDEADKVILESGDVLIDGGESRFIYHGVTSILPDTAPTSLIEATSMCPGHLNLTFRMSKEDDDDARLSHPVFD